MKKQLSKLHLKTDSIVVLSKNDSSADQIHAGKVYAELSKVQKAIGLDKEAEKSRQAALRFRKS